MRSKLIYILTLLFLLTNSYIVYSQQNAHDLSKAKEIALEHQKAFINRNFPKVIGYLSPDDLEELEAKIYFVINEGNKVGVISPFSSLGNSGIDNKFSKKTHGSLLNRYYKKIYGTEVKEYHKEVIKSLKVLDVKLVSHKKAIVTYSFDAYGDDEPVNLRYDKTLIKIKNKWYVKATELPVGRMVDNFKKVIESKKVKY